MQAAVQLPPDDILSDSKRGHEQLLSYWQRLAGDRKFPRENEIDTDALAPLWTSCFLLNTRESANGSYKYEFMGPSLVEAYGVDLTGQQHDHATEPSIESILKSFGKVVESGVHVVDESEFYNSQKMKVKYRCALVPFGEAPLKVNYILGLMRWKYE